MNQLNINLEINKVKTYGKTAISRKTPSLPMRWLHKNGLLDGKRMLDFGSGRGFDAFYFSMEEYDPHHYPEKPRGTFDVITCNYVLNVVEPSEVPQILSEIRSLLKEDGVAYVSVRRDKDTLKRQHLVKLSEEVIKENSNFAIYKIKK